jgi:hypothetical protein
LRDEQGLTTLQHKKSACYNMLHRLSDFDGFFGTTQATEKGHEIWKVEYTRNASIGQVR